MKTFGKEGKRCFYNTFVTREFGTKVGGGGGRGGRRKRPLREMGHAVTMRMSDDGKNLRDGHNVQELMVHSLQASVHSLLVHSTRNVCVL